MSYNQPINHSTEEKEFYSNYFSTNPLNCNNHNYSENCINPTDIYAICFNNLFLIEYQIKTLKAFFKSPYNLIIVDNNNWLHTDVSDAAKKLCEQENVIYLKAPDNFYQKHFDPTMKLGTTMSWIFHNCVKIRKPKYFGYLDHDCLMFSNKDICSYLDRKGMYGRISRKDENPEWNLHVTTNFYLFDFVKDLPLDFRAAHKYQLDTNGANYDVLFRHHNSFDYGLHTVGLRYKKEDVSRANSVQFYEIIDGCWYHMAGSTHDQLAGEDAYKLAFTKGFLDSRLINEHPI